VARASWTFPIAGLVIGFAASLVYWLAIRVNVAPQPAAALAVAATMLLTGAMHEDGLADTADALGGATREKRLDIMRDSRIGSFGALALIISALLRWSTIADIAEPRYVALALIAAHVAARAGLPAFMHLVPTARADGLSSGAGRPPSPSVIAALLLGALWLLFSFGLTGSVIAVLLLACTGFLLARIATRQFGGQTGDVLGAMEQIAEAAILLTAASLF
jgi:adenosylcobinamide-GDP ribazoletransferase